MLQRRPNHPDRRSTARRISFTLSCLALAVAGCGSDDPEGANETAQAPSTDEPADTEPAQTEPAQTEPAQTDAADTTEPATDQPAETVAAAAADVSATCDPYYEINAVLGGAGDPSRIPALLDALEPVVPVEIEEPLSTMITAAREVAASGGQDDSAFQSVEFQESVPVVERWMFDNCEFDNRVEVDAIDFAYEGLDPSYPSGTTAFLVTNRGIEAHEMVLVRRNDDVTDSWEDLFDLPEEEALSKVTPMGSAWVGPPGSQETLVADLTPGSYVVACFIASGTTVSADGSFTEGTGEPHLALGMQTEFTVE